MGAGKIAAAVIVCVIIVAGGLYAFSMIPGGGDNPTTMTIKFSAMDTLAGSQDAATSAIDIYRLIDGGLVKQETVTCDALQKESGIVYTSGESLYFKLYDATDTSLCTQFVTWTVPSADPAAVYDGSFQCTASMIDKGDTAKDILIQYHNNTAIADSATLDVTNESWDSNYAEIDLELRALDDDSGYRNTYNFIREYDNDHFIVIKCSGTGWDSVNLLSGSGFQQFEKASARYFVIPLTNEDVTRDLQAAGQYDPDGTFSKSMVFDLTGFEVGDSVTLAYEYRWYASWDYFKTSSSWGVDSSSTAESVTVQY